MSLCRTDGGISISQRGTNTQGKFGLGLPKFLSVCTQKYQRSFGFQKNDRRHRDIVNLRLNYVNEAMKTQFGSLSTVFY
jgi:hypothetical protein